MPQILANRAGVARWDYRVVTFDPKEQVPADARDGSSEKWEDRFPRTHHDLVSWFLSRADRITARDLVRHNVLNKADVPLREDEIAFLDQFVRVRADRLRQMMNNQRQAQYEEMVYLAETGHVDPIEIPELSDRAISDVVRQIRQSAEPGSYFDRMPTEDLYAHVKANPPVSAALRGLSHFTHERGAFLFKQFPVLPNSDRMFEDMRFFCGQFLVEVCLWFESHGYASAFEINEVIDGISTFTPQRLRQIEVKE